MAMKYCPNDPGHKTFITTAHEMHDWLVDEDGNFLEDRGCDQVSHKPDEGNTWTCATCGAEAVNEPPRPVKAGGKSGSKSRS